MLNHTLFVDNNCTSCKKIRQYIAENNLTIKSVNIDEESYRLEFPLMIIPALVRDQKLIAYGPDIITYLQKMN